MDFWLIVQQNDGERRYRLDDAEALIGQSSDCAIRIAEPSVSRRHARIRRDGDQFTLEDLDSTNGTRLNGARVIESAAVPPGALIEFGEVSARIEQRGSAELALKLDLPVASAQGDAGATLPGAPLNRFVLHDLRELMRAARAGETVGALARRACALLATRQPQAQIEIAQRAGERSEYALIAGEIDTHEGASCLEQPPFRIRWHDPDAGGEIAAVLPLVLELLLLVEPPAVGQASAPVDESIAPPEPRSRDPRIVEIYRQAARIAPARDIGVLIEGESGTGKELLAGYLHRASGASGAMIAVNCAALPRDLLEAELFGVERGAATGVEARPGKFEQAHGGTLFLDEIGELAPEVQAKLLRVLQERKVARLGAQSTRSIDVRVVAATNRELRREVDAGRFRLDLYHRIADWTVRLPSLRERRGDLLSLAAHFLERECRKRGLSVSGLSRDALAAMQAYDWPGNVRELEREMMRAALFMDNGQVLDAALLSERIREPAAAAGGRESALTRTAIETAIEAAAGNMSQAADHLGVARSTLYRRMKALGLTPP